MFLEEEISELLEHPDVRVSEWLLMDNIWKTVALVTLYVLFVKIVGPALMENRDAFVLKSAMIAYNFFQVGISAWIFFSLGTLSWFSKYDWLCEPVDYSMNSDALQVARIFWIGYLVKFLDFADTVFFVLRKKDSQITFLHVFHHALVPITVWIGVKYGPGGYNTMFLFVNSFVHMCMYLYYGLAACGHSVQKYLWWKRYLTKLQMIQFVIVFLFMTVLLVNPKCKVSKPLVAINWFKAIIFFFLFWNFYSKVYNKKREMSGEVKKQASDEFDAYAIKKSD